MNEIRIVATMVAKEEYKDIVCDALKAVVIPSRQEAGNIKYELHQDIKHDGTYVFFEIWKSQDALDEHNKTLHFKELLNKIDGKLDVLDIKLLKQM
ncbi:MAG TPA: antibiotic biosynthesis monooxygenase [Morganella sp. (in: Bacteria)]|nr:antibiotic biosynthesis monooxygenase [Morganella sp. (in: enterobacteria)]